MPERCLLGLDPFLQLRDGIMHGRGEVVDRFPLEGDLPAGSEAKSRQAGHAQHDRHDPSDPGSCSQPGVFAVEAAGQRINWFLPAESRRLNDLNTGEVARNCLIDPPRANELH